MRVIRIHAVDTSDNAKRSFADSLAIAPGHSCVLDHIYVWTYLRSALDRFGALDGQANLKHCALPWISMGSPMMRMTYLLSSWLF